MLIYFNDASTKLSVAINPQHVACVFITKDEVDGDVTILNLINGGNVAVSESQMDVVGRIQSELK
jgi:uncharacterized protein YlzI (FlbEa/FlbD family)